MKTRTEHIRSLTQIQRSIVSILLRVDKEGHIPVHLLRIWGSNVKAAAAFMKRRSKRR